MRLPDDSCWELHAGRVDPEVFFRVLPDHFPEATTFYFEGAPTSPEVLQLFRQHSRPGELTPGANTIWPTSMKFRCAFSAGIASALAELASRHAIPELFDHLFIYRHDDYLLYWHDAFDNGAYLSPSLPSDRVQALAQALGCSVSRAGSSSHRR